MKQKSFAKLIIGCLTSLLLTGCNADPTALSQTFDAISAHDYATAVSLTDTATAGGGGDKAILRARGIALLAQGDHAKAADTFIQALRTSNGLVEQTDIDISYYLAVAQYKMGDLDNARSTMDAILALRPKDDGAYFMRGKIELAQSDKEAALSDFDRTVTLAPSNYDRYVGIYEELCARGYESEASSYLEKAMSAGSKLSDYNKGVLEYYLGSYTEARTDLENAKKSGNSENLTLYLGRTYEALGDTTYAMTLYEDYLRENSSAGRIYEQLSTCNLGKGDYDKALENIEAGLTLGNGEGDKGLKFNRVVAYEMLYDFDKAKKSMEEYLESYPDDEVALRENVFLSSR